MTSFSLKPGNKKPNVAALPKLSIFQQTDDDDNKPQSKAFAFQNAKAGGSGFLLNLTQSSKDKVSFVSASSIIYTLLFK